MNPSKWMGAVASAVVAAVLPACDAVNLQELKPGISTSADVRARMGPPAIEHANADGTVTYEYSRQPNGTHCYMITIGRNDIVQSIDQVLTEANLAKVQAGMTRTEVRRLLGAPGSVMPFPGLKEEVWDWRVAGTIPTEEAHFHAHFDVDSGLLTKTSRRVETKG